MSTRTDVEAMIKDLARWYPAMLADSTTALSAVKYSHAHTTGLQADSQPERATYARDRLERDLDELVDIARVLEPDRKAWEMTIVFGIMASNVRTLQAWPEHRTIIETIHARWQQVCEPVEETSTWLCPSCGTAQLRWRHQQKVYVCPACEYNGTAQNVTNMRRYVITQADAWISKRQAIELFGFESRQALEHHIKAGHLDLVEGEIHTAQLRGLRRNL